MLEIEETRKVFDSFVTEGLLAAHMRNVFHWAAWYGSSLSLDRLLRHGADVEEQDTVMRHTRDLLFSFVNLGREFTNHVVLKSGKFEMVCGARC